MAAIQHSISCVTRAVLVARDGYHVSDRPQRVALGTDSPISLKGSGQLSLWVSQWYRLVEIAEQNAMHRVVVVGYLYAFDDANGREVVAFQWHPQGASPITYPHFHLGAGAQIGRRELQGCHIPTGMIALEQVIRLAIEEPGVEPLRGDWDDVLREGQTVFEE